MLARLRDRRLVTLRRIRPQDKAMLADGLLPPQSGWTSAPGPKPRFIAASCAT